MGNTLNGKDFEYYLKFVNFMGQATTEQVAGLNDALDTLMAIASGKLDPSGLKTINGMSLVGSGNITISGGGGGSGNGYFPQGW